MNLQIGDNLIRNWRRDDAASVARYANNRKIWINLRDAFPHPYGLEDAEFFIAHVLDSDPQTVFAIATPSQAIGSIGLMMGRDVHRYTAEIGYWLAEPFWGRGIMTRAVTSLTDYGIREWSLQRIYAEPYVSNHASVRVLEKAGFHCEGVLRANAFKDGRVLDQYLYAFVAGTDSRSSP
jgi:RimJ/RimL family protein N-acetyltransferase